MRIEKINSNQVRCLMTKQDLLARNITTKELRYGSKEAKKMFSEVVEQVKKECSFNKENLPIMVEAIPMDKDELMLIISAVEHAEEMDPHYASIRDEEEATEETEQPEREPDISETMTTGRVVFRFDGMDRLIEFTKKMILFPGNTKLYRGQGAHEFYLLIEQPEKMAREDFLAFVRMMMEMGEIAAQSFVLSERLMEYETPVMLNPHQVLPLV